MYEYNFYKDGLNNYSAEEFYARHREKKSIRRAANIIGGAVVAQTAVNFAASLILGLVLGLTGRSYLMNDAFFLNVFQIVVSVLMFIPVFVFAAKKAGIKISRACSFSVVEDKGTVLPALLIGYGICVIANIVNSIITQFLSSFGLDSSVDFPTPEGFSGFLLMIFSVAVVPALVEEFAFRGVVLSLLKPYGDGFAIAVSALIFGLMHGNMSQIPFAIIVGFVLGYITVRTGSVWVSIALHFINNFMSVVLTYITMGMSEDSAAFVSVAWIFCSVCLLVSGVAVANGQNKVIYVKSKSNSLLAFSERMKIALSAPGMIFAFAVFAFEIILSFTK